MVSMKVLSLATAVLSLAGSAFSSVQKPLTSTNILPSTFTPPQYFRNVNLVRVVNLEKSFPRNTINVVIENICTEPQDEYFLPFTKHEAEKLGVLEVRDKKDTSLPPFAIETVAIESARYATFLEPRWTAANILAPLSSTRSACHSHLDRRLNKPSPLHTPFCLHSAPSQLPFSRPIRNTLSTSSRQFAHHPTSP